MILKVCTRCGLLPAACKCPPRWREKDARRPSSHKRGYTPKHRKMRKREKRRVDTGTVRCARGAQCAFRELVGGAWVGGLIRPGQDWDLDHDDTDRSRYLGPSHARCNRATSTHRKGRL